MVTSVAVLAAITIVIKGAGVLLPEIPPAVARRLAGLAPGLLAALVYVEITDDGVPRLDEKAAGVAVAIVLAWRRAPFAVCVVAAALVAALLRAA